jgi:hypothetical protein
MIGTLTPLINAGFSEQGSKKPSRRTFKVWQQDEIRWQSLPSEYDRVPISMVNIVEPKEKGKMKVLTSEKAKQGGSVDPSR